MENKETWHLAEFHITKSILSTEDNLIYNSNIRYSSNEYDSFYINLTKEESKQILDIIYDKVIEKAQSLKDNLIKTL